MKTRFTAMILLIAIGAANARADGFAPWHKPMPHAAQPTPLIAPTVPPIGFAPWATTPRPGPRPAALAGDAPGIHFHGFGPWVGTRA